MPYPTNKPCLHPSCKFQAHSDGRMRTPFCCWFCADRFDNKRPPQHDHRCEACLSNKVPRVIHVTVPPGEDLGFRYEGTSVKALRGGRAQQAGVEVGWRIVAIGKEKCTSHAEVDMLLKRAKQGNTSFEVSFEKAAVEETRRTRSQAYVANSGTSYSQRERLDIVLGSWIDKKATNYKVEAAVEETRRTRSQALADAGKRGQQVPANSGTSYSQRECLDIVLGSWIDKNATNYKVELDAAGYSCAVKTVRASGETERAVGLIRLDDKADGRVICNHGGRRCALSAVFIGTGSNQLYLLETASPSQLCWKPLDNSRDIHWWREDAAEAVTPTARPRRFNIGEESPVGKMLQAHAKTSWRHREAARHEEALQARGVSSKSHSEGQRTLRPPRSEVEQTDSTDPATEETEDARSKIAVWSQPQSDGTEPTTTETEKTRSKLVDFLTVPQPTWEKQVDWFDKRKDLLWQIVGTPFRGHHIQTEDVIYAIAKAEGWLYGTSRHAHEVDAEPYLSAACEIVSVSSSPRATDEGESTHEAASENELAFDPLS